MKRRVAEAVTPRPLGGRLEEEGGEGGDSAATRLLGYSAEDLKRKAAVAVTPRALGGRLV